MTYTVILMIVVGWILIKFSQWMFAKQESIFKQSNSFSEEVDQLVIQLEKRNQS